MLLALFMRTELTHRTAVLWLTKKKGNWKIARVAFYLSNSVLPSSFFLLFVSSNVQ